MNRFDEAFRVGFERGLGITRRPADLAPPGTTLDFVRNYGVIFDGVLLANTLDAEWRHLRPIYADDSRFLVIMAAAQSGKSIFAMCRVVREMLDAWGGLFGYYFPDNSLPVKFSRDRFSPFIRKQPVLRRYYGTMGEEDSDRVGHKVDRAEASSSIARRQIGPSILYFMSVGGTTTTEGAPLRGVLLDEVRRMKKEDIALVEERYSAQRDPFDIKVSTAGSPGVTIDRAFRQGDQHYFHTECSCPEGVVIPLTFPDCVGPLKTASPALLRKVEHKFRHHPGGFAGVNARAGGYPPAVYLCPRCGDILDQPNEGWWEPHGDPEARVRSYQLSQALSPLWPAARLWNSYSTTDDIPEFWRSKIGIAFVDKEAMILQRTDIEGAQNMSLAWYARLPASKLQRLPRIVFGVDCQAGYLILVVKQVHGDGTAYTVHLDVLYGDDPFRELRRMIRAWNARMVVIDNMPHWNEVLRLVKEFPGKVFAANYWTGRQAQPRMVVWGDMAKAPNQLGEGRITNTVTIDAARGFLWMAGLWKRGLIQIPPLDQLVMRLPRNASGPVLSSGLAQGVWAPTRVASELYMRDLCVMAKRNTWAGDEGMVARGMEQWIVEAAEGSADFAHAELYAMVGCSRIMARHRGEDGKEGT